MIIRIDAGILTADDADNTDGKEKEWKGKNSYIFHRCLPANRVDFFF